MSESYSYEKVEGASGWLCEKWGMTLYSFGQTPQTEQCVAGTATDGNRTLVQKVPAGDNYVTVPPSPEISKLGFAFETAAAVATGILGCGYEDPPSNDPPPCNCPNHPPIIRNVYSNEIIQSGELFTFTVRASDEDGDTISFSVEGLPEGADFDSAMGQLSWLPTPQDVGTHRVQFTASDGKESSLPKTIIFNVRPEPPPPAPVVVDQCPQIAGNAGGDTVVTWVREKKLLMSVQADGLPDVSGDSAIQVTDQLESMDTFPCLPNKRLDINNAGNIETCWQEAGSYRGGPILCRQYSREGQPLTDAQPMVNATDRESSFSMAQFEDSRFAISWIESTNVYLQIFSSTGSAENHPLRVNLYNLIVDGWNEGNPAIAVAGDQIALTWNNGGQINFQRFHVSEDFLITPMTAGPMSAGGTDNVYDEGSPAIAMNGEGVVAIATADHSFNHDGMQFYVLNSQDQLLNSFLIRSSNNYDNGYLPIWMAPSLLLDDTGHLMASVKNWGNGGLTVFKIDDFRTIHNYLEVAPADRQRINAFRSGSLNNDSELSQTYSLSARGNIPVIAYLSHYQDRPPRQLKLQSLGPFSAQE